MFVTSRLKNPESKMIENDEKQPAAAGVADRVREVKQSLRGVMNGPVSQSMREKGLAYRVNFGVELPRLRQMAAGWAQDSALAAALWQEDIRECRLLAPMLMPADQFDGQMADLWADQMRYPEEAEVAVLCLFSRLPFASGKAFEWVAGEQPMRQLCGWLLLGRLFQQGMRPAQRDADELLDQAECALRSGEAAVRTAAGKTLLRYMDFGPEEERRGEDLLSRLQGS